DVRFNWWGSSDPAVVYPEIVQAPPAPDPRPWLLSGADTPPASTPGFQGDVGRIAYDAGPAAGDGSPDAFSLQRATPTVVTARHGATTIASAALTEVLVYGSGDADTFTVNAASGAVTTKAGFAPGGGTDALVVDDSTRSTGERYILDPTTLERANAGHAYFDSATEAVQLRGGSAADKFDVTPSPNTDFEVRGADPTSSPGDQLTYRDSDLSATRTPPSGPDGQVADAGLKPVVFTGIEDFFFAVPGFPAPTTPAGEQGGGTTPVQPDTIRPLAGALRLSPSRIARRGTRQRAIPRLSFTLSEAASVQIVMERKLTGRRAGSRCSTSARTGPRCTVFRRALSVDTAGVLGANSVSLPSQVRSLPRGTYRLTLVATDAAGNKSAARRVNLTIVR
ncbi:MAG: trimeric autotransporter adhesin, partial [Thermoleophilales bacterium]|nr:trimeric autotransporter adhesin [Thermoleophilales bacterium]